MQKIPLIVPITDLRQDALAVLERLKDSAEPVVITQRGRAAAVLPSPEVYERSEKDERCCAYWYGGNSRSARVAAWIWMKFLQRPMTSSNPNREGSPPPLGAQAVSCQAPIHHRETPSAAIVLRRKVAGFALRRRQASSCRTRAHSAWGELLPATS